MNIEDAVLAHETETRQTDDQSASQDYTVLFVAPNPDVLPNDGILVYNVVTSVYDFQKSFPAFSVVLIPDDMLDVLKVVVEHQDIFGVRLRVLRGLPQAEYSVSFDQQVWGLDQASYGPLVSEIRLEAELQQMSRSSNMTKHDIERAQFTRSDGVVRDQKNFDVVDEKSASLDDDAILE